MAELTGRRLQGNILEPMIALIIVLLSVSAAFTVVVKARTQFNVVQVSRANILASKVFSESLEQKEYISQEFMDEGLMVNKQVKWFDKSNNLLQLSVEVIDNKGRTLSMRRQLLIIDSWEVKD